MSLLIYIYSKTLLYGELILCWVIMCWNDLECGLWRCVILILLKPMAHKQWAKTFQKLFRYVDCLEGVSESLGRCSINLVAIHLCPTRKEKEAEDPVNYPFKLAFYINKLIILSKTRRVYMHCVPNTPCLENITYNLKNQASRVPGESHMKM